jgi:hypothetical protein
MLRRGVDSVGGADHGMCCAEGEFGGGFERNKEPGSQRPLNGGFLRTDPWGGGEESPWVVLEVDGCCRDPSR